MCAQQLPYGNTSMFEFTIPFWPQNGLMEGKLVYEICPDLGFDGSHVTFTTWPLEESCKQ